jgi:uncharacterized UBP type Zn finger protein
MTPKDSVKIVGRAKMTKQDGDPSHSQLCKAICDYMRTKYPDVLFIHIPNEGKRSPQQGKKLKDEGLLPGVYDYFCAKVKLTYQDGALISVIPGMWIEVKKKADKLTKAQLDFKERATKAHYSTMEVYDIDYFMSEIDEYLK